LKTSSEITASKTDEMSELAKVHGPEGGTLPQWQDARARLENYLRALNPAGPEQNERIISAVLDRATAIHSEVPEAEPLALVMSEFHELLGQWFQQSLPPGDLAAGSGLVSHLAVDARQKWPEAFLSNDPPVELQHALQNCAVQAAPNLRVTRMVPQPFDNLLGDLNLPTALAQLSKDLPPSMVAKLAAFVMSGIALLSGNRLR
jgi:hypothetical protein